MSSMFGGISSSAAKPDVKTQIMEQYRQEAAMQNAKALIDKLNSHCFDKCVPAPGSSLSKGETACFTQCMEKYMHGWNVVSQQYIERIRTNSNSN